MESPCQGRKRDQYFLSGSQTQSTRTSSNSIQWSQAYVQIIAFLAVTDCQELIPLLSATASSNDIIEKYVMFKRILSDLIENIKKKTDNQVKRRQVEQTLKQKSGLKKKRMS